MLGLMQDWPLTVDSVLDHAAAWHGGREVVSPLGRRRDRAHHLRPRSTSAPSRSRTPSWPWGSGPATGSATVAWNTARHLEAWYGIMGIGAVGHTLNPRLLARAARLDHQPRRRPHDLRRPDVRARAGRDPAGLPAVEKACMTDFDPEGLYDVWIDRTRHRLRLGRVRREHGGGALLHLGHHRQPQGRALLRTARTSCTRW